VGFHTAINLNHLKTTIRRLHLTPVILICFKECSFCHLLQAILASRKSKPLHFLASYQGTGFSRAANGALLTLVILSDSEGAHRD
jgi:hypothetical protein